MMILNDRPIAINRFNIDCMINKIRIVHKTSLDIGALEALHTIWYPIRPPTLLLGSPSSALVGDPKVCPFEALVDIDSDGCTFFEHP